MKNSRERLPVCYLVPFGVKFSDFYRITFNTWYA